MFQRSRKCSIVREEEDDEESAVPAARPVDSRRGSRSEGRLHLAAHAHLAPAPPCVAPPPHRTHLAENLTRVVITLPPDKNFTRFHIRFSLAVKRSW